MAEVTYEQLDAFAKRIEESSRADVARLEAATRRELDQFRADVKDDLRQIHGRVSELRDERRVQNGRLEKVEEKAAKLDTEIATVRQDLAGHLGNHESFKALATVMRNGQAPTVSALSRRDKSIVAAMVLAAAALAGLGAHALEFLTAIVKLVNP